MSLTTFFDGLTSGWIGWQPLLSASLMMAAVGLLAVVIFKCISVRSWRLRSTLAAAVLLQGLMLVRAPIHLGWIQRPVEPVSVVSLSEHRLSRIAIPPARHAEADGQVAIPVRHAESNSDAAVVADRVAIDWRMWVWSAWLGVAASILILALWRYIRVLKLIGGLHRAPDDWRKSWESMLTRSRLVGSRDRCEMLVSQSVGPLLVRRLSGYALIVPEAYWSSLTEDQRRAVMLHELAHLHRRDVWRQLLARMIVTIHWFNPLAWWALRQYELACECACDQRVADGGRRAAAGFASALVQLVQWRSDSSHQSIGPHRGIGFQAMAAPPLNTRISRLLKPSSTGDSPMKRTLLALLAITLIVVSFFQFRLTSAQERREGDDDAARRQLRVLSGEAERQLDSIGSQLDVGDPTTERFRMLMDEPSGRLAIAGYLNALAGQSREAARTEAIPRFVEHHFTRDDNGKLVPKGGPETFERWMAGSHRLADEVAKLRRATAEIAERMDTTREVDGLFKRLLMDPQAPVAVLMNEMGGTDVVERYLSEALDELLVDQGNGMLRVVESRRQRAEREIERFELADQLSHRLRRELPNLASEYATDDEQHERLTHYMRHPLMATVAALQLSDDVPSVGVAVEKLYEHFENVSIDTADGWKIAEDEAWEMLEEMYARVDRAESILPRIQEKLAQVSENLAVDDPLTRRMAEQMKREPVAVLLAAELPYAEADPGEELLAMLSEVMTERDGKWSIQRDREEEVSEKARELLQVCRRIRRYVGSVEDMLDQVADRQFVDEIGEAGRYLMLAEIRQFAERHQPNPVALMTDDLLMQTDNGQLRVREERREVVRHLVEQAEQVRAEAAIDDF